MPTYEYECRSCGHRFERFGKMSDEPLGRCPRCEGPARRLISAGAGVIVKGGRTAGAAGACSLENTGKTCCGMSTPCRNRPCGEGG